MIFSYEDDYSTCVYSMELDIDSVAGDGHSNEQEAKACLITSMQPYTSPM